MPSSNDPNTGLYYGWNYGENFWDSGMDQNMQIIGAIVQGGVKSRSVNDPATLSPLNGDVYFVPTTAINGWSGQGNQFAVYYDVAFDNAPPAGWIYIPLKAGVQFRINDETGFDGQTISVFYTGSALTESADMTNFVQKNSSYTATGAVDYTGTLTYNGVEVATTADVAAAISGQDFSAYALLGGSQSFTGANTFTNTISGIAGVADSDLVTKLQMETEIDLVTGFSLGAGTNVYANKTGQTLNFKSFTSNDSSVTINGTTNPDVIDLSVDFTGLVTTFLQLTDTPIDYTGSDGFVATVDETGQQLIFAAPAAGLIEVYNEGSLVGSVAKINFAGVDIGAYLDGDTVNVFAPDLTLIGNATITSYTPQSTGIPVTNSDPVILGDTVTSTTLGWSYDPALTVITSLTLTGSTIGNISVLTTDITKTITDNLTDNESFDFSAGSAFGNAVFSTQLPFVNYIYSGRSNSTTLSEAQVEALTQVPSDTNANTYSFIEDTGAGDTYLYICYPTRLGLLTRWDNLASSFDIAMTTNVTNPLIQVLSMTNALGHTEDYYVQRSINTYAAAVDVETS